MKDHELIGHCSNPTHIQYNGEKIDLSTFKWKGCWGCHHFHWEDPKSLIDVKDASEILDISKSTIRRLIRQDSLEGRIFTQGRNTNSLPSSRKYFIEREDFEKFLKEFQGGEK